VSEAQIASLDQIDLLASLTPEERASIVRQCRWRRYKEDEQIIDHLSDTRDACLVVEGRVRVVMFSMSGREISFDDVSAGGYMGELSALDGEPRSATVIALTDTLIAFVPPRLFQEIVTTHPRVALIVMQRMAAVIRNATGRIMDLSTLGANNRVHAEIVRLAKLGLRPDNTAEITPIPVHGDIASRVSTTRETVARVLSDLARNGLVERRGHTLVVKDYTRLVDMVEEVRGE
jgi:CRP/FNR family cyclic AMP-dependent transcriptional regulator